MEKGKAPRPLPESVIAQALEMRAEGISVPAIAEHLGVTKAQLYYWLERTKPQPQPQEPAYRIEAQDAQASDLAAELRAQREEIARLKAQLTWAQRCDVSDRTGGTMTIRTSDWHTCDAGHLLSSRASADAKILEVVRMYQPSRIQVVGFDDLVSGIGIYKEQAQDNVLPQKEQQERAGAWRWREFMLSLRSVSDAPISVICLKGNHSYANGHSFHQSLFFAAKALCQDIEDLSMRMAHDQILLNLAHEGDHWAMFAHGYGGSKNQPNSPGFVADMKDKMLTLLRRIPSEQVPRRISSGHTHWLSVGMEHVVGYKWDTTGGWQRNERVKLGLNQRPSGDIVYVSLPGSPGDILEPIAIQPDDEIYWREIESSTLADQNRHEAARLLTEYKAFGEAEGWLEPEGIGGVILAGR